MIKSSDYITATGGSTDFYKCATIDSTNHTWTGYKLIPNADNGFELESSASAVGEYYVMPTVNKIYDATGKLELKSYYGGDNYDPYGDGLLYSIFINGGTGIYAPSYGAVTTDSYTSNVETVNGITARRFYSNNIVTATVGSTRNVWSYSVWLKAIEEGTFLDHRNLGIVGLGTNSNGKIFLRLYGYENVQYELNISIWHHYVVTYNQGAGNLYVDGSFIKSFAGDIGFHSGFRFGDESYDFYRGYAANFRFYDHVLTSEEVSTLYSELTPSNS